MTTTRGRVPDLALDEVVEGGVRFATGVPVEFRYVHNDQPAPRLGALFGQDLEPAGLYVQHVAGTAPPPSGWHAGTARLARPLVLRLTVGGRIYGPDGWKARLARHYGRRRAALTRALLAAGHDGVVTTSTGGGAHHTDEIVLLRPERAVIGREPGRGGKGRRAAGGAAGGAQILYHVTFAKNVPKIRRRGLLLMQPSLWVKASDRSRYGRGEIFAFESATDAVRWAAKMDWELNRNMGTGDVVVVAFDGGDRRWAVDESDPLSQAGGEGRWLKSDAAVPPAAILRVHPVTLALVRQVTAGRVRLEGGGKGRRADVDAPAVRTYYRGTNPERGGRISTGTPEWDDNLFVTREERFARDYGRQIEVIEVRPDARVLTERQGGFPHGVRTRRGERFADYALRALRRARELGYDVIEFQLQGTVGTIIINRDAIVARRVKNGGGGGKARRAARDVGGLADAVRRLTR